MEKNRNKRKQRIVFFIAFSITVLLLICFYHISPFIFITNDDVSIHAIVSGGVTGKPEAHLFHIGYISGLLVSNLYRLIPTIPWYGLFLTVSIGISLFIILYKTAISFKQAVGACVAFAFLSLLFYSFFFIHIVELQFTTVTGIVGAGAVFCFILIEIDDDFAVTFKSSISFLLIVFLSISIRSEVFIMQLPFIGLAFLSKYLDSGRGDKLLYVNSKRKNLLSLTAVLIVVMSIPLLFNFIAYKGEEWSKFKEFNNSRALVYDYYGYPNYDENKEFYDKIGIDQSEYNNLQAHYNLVLSDIDSKKLEEISKESKQQYLRSVNMMERLKSVVANFLERHLNYADRPINLLVYSIYIMLVFIAIVWKRYLLLRDIALLIVARMVVWVYLLYNGRYPVRVTQVIYITELCVLLALALKYKLWEGAKKLFTLMLAAITIISVVFGMAKSRGVFFEVSTLLQYDQSYLQMKDYFKEHPDNLYYLDMNSFTFFSEEVFSDIGTDMQNYILMGSWLPCSPWYSEKLRQLGIDDVIEAPINSEKIFFVFQASQDGEYDYLRDYYMEHYPGTQVEVVDQVETANNIVFDIIAVHYTTE